jgi:fructoselysine-6-P-deglycase FrlB-like protein
MSNEQADTSVLEAEVRSQPGAWRQAAELASATTLPQAGERVMIVGCGTSLFAGQAIATWRESAGQGETDAFAGSEVPTRRRYDRVVVISRSGTTTEVLRALDALEHRSPVLALTATDPSPVVDAADDVITLDFADEVAIPQTRFPTSVIALWRAQLGHDVGALARRADAALEAPLPAALLRSRQFVFLGTGPAAGLASEASLKFRETALVWTEAYPAMELRHGPISLLGPESQVWALGPLPPGLSEEILATGAQLEVSGEDPLVELVRVHRAALALARAKDLDPDNPPRLQRSIVLG